MVNLNYYWKKKTLLSFIAVIFVIIIHNSATNQYSLPPDPLVNTTHFIHNTLAYGIGAIAVPIFFFISGFSMFRNYTSKLYLRKVKSRVKTILIPYLIWNIIGLLFCILYTYTPLSTIISGRETFTPTIKNILEGIFLYKYNFQFWFLYDLIIFVILTPIFNFIVSRKWLGIIFGIIFLILPIFTESFLNINLYFVIFYYLGCLFGKHYLKTFSSHLPKKYSASVGVLFIILLIIKILAIYNLLQLPIIISQLILVLLLVSAWFFSDLLIPKSKLPNFTNEFFPIYTLHTYFLAIIIKIIYLFLPKTSLFLLINEISSTVLTVILTTTLAYFWHQRLPKSYQIMFGHK